MTLHQNIEFLLFSNKFCPNKTAFGNEEEPKVSIEVGCQVSLVGRHIEEPAVSCVSGCPNFLNKKRSASLPM